MGLIDLAKRIPIDLGQGAVAETTEGKQIALRLVPDGHGRKALDVGAREGNQTRWLQQRGYEVTSMDVDQRFPECHVVDANQRLPFEDAEFDLVWCSEVIEHLADPRFSLDELRRITKPGGELILTTPNSYMWLFRMLDAVGLTPDKLQRDDHLHFFDLKDIQGLAPDARLYGYFPYLLLKRKVSLPRLVGLLSPTFVMHIKR